MYAKDVLKSKAFKDLKRSDVTAILKSDRLNPEKEANVLNAALEWARIEMKRDPPKNLASNAKDADKLKAVMGQEMFTAIRFPVMDISDIALSVTQTGLLEQDQILSLFTYLGQRAAAGDKGKPPPLDSSLKMFTPKARNPRDPMLVFDAGFRVGSSARSHSGYRMMTIADFHDKTIRGRWIASYNKKQGLEMFDTMTITNAFMVAGGFITINGECIVNKGYTGSHHFTSGAFIDFGINSAGNRFPGDQEWNICALSGSTNNDGYPAFFMREKK